MNNPSQGTAISVVGRKCNDRSMHAKLNLRTDCTDVCIPISVFHLFTAAMRSPCPRRCRVTAVHDHSRIIVLA